LIKFFFSGLNSVLKTDGFDNLFNSRGIEFPIL